MDKIRHTDLHFHWLRLRTAEEMMCYDAVLPVTFLFNHRLHPYRECPRTSIGLNQRPTATSSNRRIQSDIHIVKRHIRRSPSAHTTRLESELRRSLGQHDLRVHTHRLRAGDRVQVPDKRRAKRYVAPASRAGVRDVEVYVCLYVDALPGFAGALQDLLVVRLRLVADVDLVERHAGGAVYDSEGHAAGAIICCPWGEAGGEVVVRQGFHGDGTDGVGACGRIVHGQLDVVEGDPRVDRGGAAAVVAAVDRQSESRWRGLDNATGVHRAVLSTHPVVEAEEILGAGCNLDVAVYAIRGKIHLDGHEVHLASGNSCYILGQTRVIGAAETHPVVGNEG